LKYRYVLAGWFCAGMLVGALGLALMTTSGFTIEKKMPIVDLAQLAATLLLAIYIPFAIDTFRDRAKSVRALLIDDVNNFVAVVRSVNSVLTSCTNSDTTTPQDVMRIRTGFLSGNVKLGRLEKRLFDVCQERCKDSYYPFKDAYTSYWKAVTDGNLYSGGKIDWNLWRKQEFPFATLEHRAAELLRFLNTI
jgi:hypothetical protein